MRDGNTYETRFTATCPVNGRRVEYALEIECGITIKVEQIQSACADAVEGFHESIADKLWAQLGGRQVIVAFHHGVKITTRRGFE